jgi:hypothetical protein
MMVAVCWVVTSISMSARFDPWVQFGKKKSNTGQCREYPTNKQVSYLLELLVSCMAYMSVDKTPGDNERTVLT